MAIAKARSDTTMEKPASTGAFDQPTSGLGVGNGLVDRMYSQNY